MHPPVIIFDVKRGMCFDTERQFKNCWAVLRTASTSSLSKVLGRKVDGRSNDFEASANWLPILDPSAAVEPQPQHHRPAMVKGSDDKPDVYPIKFDDLWNIAKQKTGSNIINGMLDMLKLIKKGTLRERVERIIEHNADHYLFTKKFVQIAGKSGGLLTVMCPHGICVGFKVLYMH